MRALPADADATTRLDLLLDSLLEAPETERAALIARLADTAPEDSAALQAWLAGIHRSEGFLEPPEDIATSVQHNSEQQLGPWRLLQRIGQGGMGEVWSAERADGAFTKQVAIKFLREDSPALRARFAQERQALARLEHPNIARLLDGGVSPEHGPFLITEHVAGVPLDVWCTREKPSLEVRLALFRVIATAVAYAHTNLVVHRDLKPANILVDSNGHPHLLDFGIAKLLDPGATSDTVERALTPEFGAPEQFTGDTVTTRTDVYALGGLLYFMLTGHLPLATRGLPLAQLVRTVCEQLPPVPSSVASLDNVPARRLRGDLDAIVLKSLAKAAEERYLSVEALLTDIDNAQHSRPVMAHSGSTGYVVRRFIRRHRVGLAVSALVMLALSIGLVGTMWQAHVASQQRDIAQAERDNEKYLNERAVAINDFLVHLLGSAAPNGEAIHVGDLLERAGNEVVNDPTLKPEARAALVSVLADLYMHRHDPAGMERVLEPILTKQSDSLPADVAAHVACQLGDAKLTLGNMAEAHRWLDFGLARASSITNAHGEHADCLTYMARFAQHDNNIDQALRLHRQAIAEADPDGTAINTDVSALYANYANTLSSADQLVQARIELQHSLDILERLGRGATADAAIDLATLAGLDSTTGLAQRADDEYTHANTLRLAASGPSAGLAVQIMNHATVKIILAEPDAAMTLLDQAETMQRDFVGPESLQIAQLAYVRGRALAASGKFSEAEAQFARASQLFDKILPEHSAFKENLRVAQAEAHMLEQPDAAGMREALGLLAVAEVNLRTLGNAGKSILSRTLLSEAEAALGAGDFDLAEAHATDARTRYADNSDTASWVIAACDIVLAKVYQQRGDTARARALVTIAVPRLEQSLGAQHPRTRDAQKLLATLNN